MTKILVSGKLGAVAEYSAVIREGKLILEVDVSSDAALDEVAAAIPGHFDDIAISALKLLIKQL